MAVLIKPPTHLKDCPFCGGKAEMKLSDAFGSNAVRIECKECHALSNLFVCGNTLGFNGISPRYVSLCECVKKVTEQWNMREGG